MRKWDVTITETLARTVSVEAESCEEAEEIAKARYERCEMILGAEEHVFTEITAEHEGICPLCGAGIAYSGHNITDDAGGMFPWKCPACGAHGDESYSRKFSGHIHVEQGKNHTYSYVGRMQMPLVKRHDERGAENEYCK